MIILFNFIGRDQDWQLLNRNIGSLVSEPNFGRRIEMTNIELMYSEMGDKFKKAYPGYQAWLLSGNEEAMKSVGLRTFDTHHLINGKIPCRFSGYRIYSGKKD